MLPTRGYAIQDPAATFEPFTFERRNPGLHDVLIEILYCGVCHSDIHCARNEWGGSVYPMVPGHEIVGRVTHVGAAVKKFQIGDLAGVGCFVDTCRACASCTEGEEQYCEKHLSLTYNSTEQDLTTPTYGGYSSQIVVDENYVLRISPKFPLANVAPLLCAGITTYAPLRRFKVSAGQRVGIMGLGGLGHMGVKFAVAMGAEVTVFSRSAAKEQDARRLGAQHFVITENPENLQPLANSFNFILDTVSAAHDPNSYLNLLCRDGVMAMVGVPEKPLEIHALSLIWRRRMLVGSLIGGIRETQEMLDYCAEKNISADVEIIPANKIAEAFERTIKSDVRYRFVIDMKTL
jgi:uncharacterized zinc-type alcohol dehydrogenase-like protein